MAKGNVNQQPQVGQEQQQDPMAASNRLLKPPSSGAPGMMMGNKMGIAPSQSPMQQPTFGMGGGINTGGMRMPMNQDAPQREQLQPGQTAGFQSGMPISNGMGNQQNQNPVGPSNFSQILQRMMMNRGG